MNNRRQIIIGSIIVIFGVVILLEAIFDIEIWGLLCPAFLIVLGVWLIFRPRSKGGDSDLQVFFAHNVRRREQWTATNEEFWGFAIDLKLDLSKAEIPPGETTIRTYGFVSELRISLPSDIGLSVNSLSGSH